MAQFYTLDEAAQRLGIAQEDFKRRLKLEWTSIRPFRDGATLRFRAADIDELARSLGQASDAGGGAPLGPVGSAPADSDTPLEAGGGDDIFAPAPQKKKSGSDSDVRLDLHPKAAAGHDPDAALPTEEIALDLSGPGSSTVIKGPGSSGKLSAPKSGVNLAGPGSAKIPSPTSKDAKSPDSSSEFELSLDSDSDSFELQLTTDSSGEVDLGSKGKSGQSGINLGRPSDSGLSLEKKGPQSGPAAKPKPPVADDSDDFELSLEPTGASGTKLGGPKSAPKKPSKGPDSSSEFELSAENSSSEFELTLDDDRSVSDSLDAAGEQSKGDIFETDFELPQLQDESGSEVVSVDETEGASGFEVDVSDVGAEDESGSQVVLVDEDAPVLDDEDALAGADLEEGASASSALRGVRRGEYDDAVGPAPVVVAGPAKWGPLPAIVLFPTVAVLVLGGLMSFEAVRGMWGYHQPAKPGASIVRGMADTFGMKTND